MNCRQIVELMTDYLEGALSAADRQRFEAHLSGCDGCTAYLAQLRKTISLTSGIANEPIPERLEVELLNAFRDWNRRP